MCACGSDGSKAKKEVCDKCKQPMDKCKCPN